MSEELINHVKSSFEKAERLDSKITHEILGIQGMTGYKTRHFYNNLLSLENVRYLEIGCWKGSSTCSALCGNKINITCIDNWSEFGGPKQEFIQNVQKFIGQNTLNYIKNDCFKVDRSSLGKFDIYLYD